MTVNRGVFIDRGQLAAVLRKEVFGLVSKIQKGIAVNRIISVKILAQVGIVITGLHHRHIHTRIPNAQPTDKVGIDALQILVLFHFARVVCFIAVAHQAGKLLGLRILLALRKALGKVNAADNQRNNAD